MSKTTVLPMLMLDAMRAEWELAHSPWITDRDPPATGTYLTSCVNRDGNEYPAMHYWHGHWHTGPFVRVLGWMRVPPPLADVAREALANAGCAGHGG